jgi:hypothetical protein
MTLSEASAELAPDAIHEFAVRTAQENGHSGYHGRSIVITTRSGTNALHGDAVFYERSVAL